VHFASRAEFDAFCFVRTAPTQPQTLSFTGTRHSSMGDRNGFSSQRTKPNQVFPTGFMCEHIDLGRCTLQAWQWPRLVTGARGSVSREKDSITASPSSPQPALSTLSFPILFPSLTFQGFDLNTRISLAHWTELSKYRPKNPLQLAATTALPSLFQTDASLGIGGIDPATIANTSASVSSVTAGDASSPVMPSDLGLSSTQHASESVSPPADSSAGDRPVTPVRALSAPEQTPSTAADTVVEHTSRTVSAVETSSPAKPGTASMPQLQYSSGESHADHKHPSQPHHSRGHRASLPGSPTHQPDRDQIMSLTDTARQIAGTSLARGNAVRGSEMFLATRHMFRSLITPLPQSAAAAAAQIASVEPVPVWFRRLKSTMRRATARREQQ